MGMYLNPGYGRYEMAMGSEIFVDKTEMISFTNNLVNTNQRYLSVSRPRRFGKSMATDMLCAYYGNADSRKLFEKTKIAGQEKWDRYLNRFDLIKVVMTDFIKEKRTVSDSLEILTERILDEFEETYPDIKYDPSDLFFSLEKFYRKNKRKIVIIVDEWDCVFRVRKDDKDGQKQYLDFLRDLFKDREYVALAYMTGILPIKKYGEHSALNMFDEYSMLSPMQLAPYTGFTTKEVAQLCNDYGRDFDEIEKWYDGYVVSDIIPPDPNHEQKNKTGESPEAKRYQLYNPLSVVKATITGHIQNYWNRTETYSALADYIAMNLEGLKDSIVFMMEGGRVKIDTSTYQNDMTTFYGRDDVLTLLIHLGYLGYDSETKEVFIPNREILDEFKTSTKTADWNEVFKALKLSNELLEATWKCDEQRVAKLLEKAHDRAENRSYNSENALSYAIQLAYYAAQRYYTTIQELDTGKGYADIVYLPSPKYPEKPALLVELKYNKSVQTAADQIRDRNYPQILEHYKGNILLVSVNYDKDAASDAPDYKHHTCLIEKA